MSPGESTHLVGDEEASRNGDGDANFVPVNLPSDSETPPDIDDDLLVRDMMFLNNQ